MIALPPLLLALAHLVAAEHLRLHHRLLQHPAPPHNFTLRAVLHIPDNAKPQLVPSDNFADDVRAFLERARLVDGAWYQLALERPGDPHQDHWDVSAVKACHLSSSTSDTVILHMNDKTNTPFAVDYFVSPVPLDGSCPPASSQQSSTSLVNTAVTVLSPVYPPTAELNKPPPLTPTGQVVQPEPEKSVLQKYWPYLAGVLLVLVLGGGGGDEKSEAGEAQAAPAGK